MSLRHLTASLAATAALSAAHTFAQTGSAIAPKFLVDPAQPGYEKQIVLEDHQANGQVTVTADGGKLVVNLAPGSAGYPGFSVKTPDGKPFDLSPWGNVSAKITNTSAPGTGSLNVNLRVDNAGKWQDNPWNAEGAWLKPGESRVIKVIFGHHYGHKPGYKLDSSKVTQVLIFTGKIGKEQSFTVEDLMASGAAGETPPVDKRYAREILAKDAHIFGKDAKFNASQLAPKNATAELSADKKKIVATFQKDGVVSVKPREFNWNFKHGNAIAMLVKNTGKTAATPKLQVASGSDRTDLTAADKPLAPGATTTVIASFVPKKPWVALVKGGGHNSIAPGTGTKFESTNANTINIYADEGAQLEITALALVAPPAQIPAWLGKHPPVPQSEWKNWKLTLDENFDKPLDSKVWNIYTDNYWDKRTHFSKDNNIVKDGKMILRYEKKRGKQNDTEEKETDYASGHADTYGKWTQRYGYWEARMKLPTANGLWPAFWTMPDRGVERGPEQWKRASTGKNTNEKTRGVGEEAGGMEFDIMEHLSGWGPYRFNQAFHWDGYDKGHKAVGSTWAYTDADKDGYITIGMLWLPGFAAYYSNGKEMGRWESERVSDTQANIILYMVSGGWANTQLNDKELPADFVVDYVRVWQRNDLATPEDGFKPNDGRWKMHSQSADGN